MIHSILISLVIFVNIKFRVFRLYDSPKFVSFNEFWRNNIK